MKIDIISGEIQYSEAIREFISFLDRYAKGQLSADDLNKCPKFEEEKVLSFIWGDDASNLLQPTDEKYIYYKYLFSNCLDIRSDGLLQCDSYLPQNILGLFVYILRCFSYGDTPKKTNIDEYFRDKRPLYDYLIENKDSLFVKFTGDVAIILFKFMRGEEHKLSISFQELLDSYGIETSSIYDQSLVNKLKDIIDKIKRKDFESFSVKEFFEMTNVFGHKVTTFPNILKGEEVEGYKIEEDDLTMLKNNILECIDQHFVENNVNDSNILEVLAKYNSIECKIIREDIFTITSFDDFPFADIHKIVNINSGYCYTYDYLAKILIMNEGVLKIDATNLDEETRTNLGKAMGTYFFKHQQLFKEFLLEDILSLISKNSLGHVPKELSALNTTNTSESYDETILQNFFVYMIKDYKADIETEFVKKMMLTSGGTLIDLIGLLGYTLYSDDIANLDETNQGGQFFQISNYCLEKINELLKNSCIKIPELQKILDGVSSTCIHGIGVQCLELYVKYREYINNVLGELESDMDSDFANKLFQNLAIDKTKYKKNELVEILSRQFALPSFIMYTPISVLHTTGYNYMVIIRNDNLINRHNLLNKYLITVLAEGKPTKKMCMIDCSNTFSIPAVFRSALDMMSPAFMYEIVSADINDNQCNYCTYIFKQEHNMDNDFLISIMRSTYTFQNHRALRFLLFTEYTKNMINILKDSPPSDLYNTLKSISQNPIYDIITLEDIKLPLKLFTVLDLTDKNGHMYGNSTNPDFKSDLHVDLLENIINLQYQPVLIENQTDKKPGILLASKGKDITRQYQYCKILATMLYPNVYMKNVEYFPISNDNDEYYSYNKKMFPLFENYFLNLHGQASTIMTRVFKNLKFVMKSDGTAIEFNKKDFPNQYKSKTNSDSILVDVTIRKIVMKLAEINLVNASIVVKDLFEIYQSTVAHISFLKDDNQDKKIYNVIADGLENLVNEILSRMRIFMLCTSSYYGSILPSNDHSYLGVWNIDENLEFTSNRNLYYKTWSSIIDKTKINPFVLDFGVINNLHERYQKVIGYMIHAICFLTMFPCVYQYHFTEINNELHLLMHMEKKIKEATNELFRTKYSNAPETYRLLVEMEASFNVFVETFHYYNDYMKLDDDSHPLKHKLNDVQESCRERFDYLAKIEIMKLHQHRMTQFKYFEDIICNLFDDILISYTGLPVENLNFELTSDQTNTIAIFKNYIQKSREADVNQIYSDNMIDLIHNMNKDVFMMNLQDFYLGCLFHKKEQDEEMTFNVEKEKVYKVIKDFWDIVTSKQAPSVKQIQIDTLINSLQNNFTSQNRTSEPFIEIDNKMKEEMTALQVALTKSNLYYKDGMITLFNYRISWIKSIKDNNKFEAEANLMIEVIKVTKVAIEQNKH
jgi:hypothetical protein